MHGKSIILGFSLVAILLFSTTAVAAGPWYFGYENLGTDKTVQKGWIPEGATSEVWESPADNTYSMFWDVDLHSTYGPQVAGFSFSNQIGAWLSLPEGHECKAIKYTVQNDYSFPATGWNNTDIIEFRSDETEELIKHGYLLGGVPDTLGIEDWNETAIGPYDRDMTALEYVCGDTPAGRYVSIGKLGRFNADGSLDYGWRNWQSINRGMWGSEEGSGYATPGTQAVLDISGYRSGEKIDYAYGIATWHYHTYSKDSGDGYGERWYGRVQILGGTYPKYDMYLEDTDGSIKPYDEDKFPEDPAHPGDEDAATGYPIRWHDDADPLLTDYTGVTTLGVSGRWIVERPEWFYWDAEQAHFHEADVMARLEDDSHIYFEHAWKIAGTMLGKKFWESGYIWSNELGAVVTREYTTELHSLSAIYLPNMINSGGGVWDFPGAADYMPGGATTPTSQSTWGFLDMASETAVAGYDDLNYFIKYVMDIDALVVEDVDGDGRFDEGEDYILFSLVDNDMYTSMQQWSGEGESVQVVPGGYFSGETIFLYDGDTVQTWFDPWDETRAIFFGQSITTNPGTLLGGAYGWYELNSLDITVPEPTTIMLIVGAGIALGAGVLRRKLR